MKDECICCLQLFVARRLKTANIHAATRCLKLMFAKSNSVTLPLRVNKNRCEPDLTTGVPYNNGLRLYPMNLMPVMRTKGR